MAAGKAKNKKNYVPHFKYNYRKKDKDEALFDLRLTNENLRKENERLLNSLYELDKKNINQSKYLVPSTEVMEQFFEGLNIMISKNIRNNTIKDFFKGWSSNVRYLTNISNETDTSDRLKIPFLKRGNIVKAHFGLNVGSELRYEHYAIVVEKMKNRNPD